MSPYITGRWSQVGLTRDRNGYRAFHGIAGVPGYVVKVRYVMENGAARLAGLKLEPETVTAPGLPIAALRSLPIADMVSTSALMAMENVPADADGRTRQKISREFVAKMFGETDDVPQRPPGGSDEFSAAVFATWERARQVNYPGGGTKAICDRWGVTANRAERWIREARKREVMPTSDRVKTAKRNAKKGKGKQQ